MAETDRVPEVWEAFAAPDRDPRQFEAVLRHRGWPYLTLSQCQIGDVVYVPHRGLFGEVRMHHAGYTHVQFSRSTYTLVYAGMLVYRAPPDQKFSGLTDKTHE